MSLAERREVCVEIKKKKRYNIVGFVVGDCCTIRRRGILSVLSLPQGAPIYG